jgi:hypothetical protein
MPQGAANGVWDLAYVDVYDRVGNARFYSPDDLTALGLNRPITQTGSGDSIPPALASLDVSPAAVDTASGPASITVTARLTDTGVGVRDTDGWLAADMRWMAPSGGQFIDATYYGSANRISGDEHDGTYRITITMPQGAANGTWTLAYADVYDRVGNARFYSPEDLADAGTNPAITNG